MPRNKRARLARSVLVAALITVLGVTAAPAASAQRVASGARGDFFEPPAPYRDSGKFDPECGGIDVTVHFRVRGVSSLRNVPGSGGQAFLLKDRYRFRDVWTETKTKRVLFTQRGQYSFEEVSAARVPNAKVPRELIPEEGLIGPVYRFKAVEVGHDTVTTPQGKVLYRTAGLVVFSGLFDTLGDSQPGATPLDVQPIKVVGPHPLLDVDLCDVAVKQARR